MFKIPNKKILLSLLFGIIVFVLIAAVLLFLFYNILSEYVYNITLLQWIPILVCVIGFYVSGRINRKTPLIWLPVLFVVLIMFKPFRFLYMPFVFVLMAFGILVLVVSREDVKRKFKRISYGFLALGFGYILFSQPLVIKKEDFGLSLNGAFVNAKVLWNFNKAQDIRFPDLQFADLNGGKVSLKTFKGKRVYLDFWATWCAPCLAERPELNALKNAFKHDEDVLFIDISLDEDKQKWLDHVAKNSLVGMQLHSDGNETKIRRELNIAAIPFHVIIDAQGHYKSVLTFDHAAELLRDPNALNDFIRDKNSAN